MSEAVSTSGRKERIQKALNRANSVLSVDFCPSANRWVYWLKDPLWLLMLAIGGSTLCGLLVNPLVFFLTGILILLSGTGVLMPWVAVRGIECAVVFDVPRTRVGSPAIVRLTVRNRWPIPVWGLSLIRGFAHDDTQHGDEGVALARVPGWTTVEYSWSFTPRRRGRYPCATAEVETGFPFGLFYARKAAQVEGHLVVWPRTARLEGVPDAPESPQTEDLFCDRRAGDGGDMTSTRAFRHGDSLRRVHWSQTARQQTLIVTERQAPSTSTVRVTVDLASESHPAAAADVTLDRCIQSAASLCESFHRQHCRIELETGHQLFAAGEVTAGYQQVMDELAVAELNAAQPSGSSRRRGFDIRVTIAHGQLPDHSRQIVVDAGKAGAGAWIDLEESADVLKQLPEHWRRVCRDA
jgi:uncharacterized protein (DUF58 family)